MDCVKFFKIDSRCKREILEDGTSGFALGMMAGAVLGAVRGAISPVSVFRAVVNGGMSGSLLGGAGFAVYAAYNCGALAKTE